METKHIAKIESEFQNTPCIIGVISHHITKPWCGNPHDCPSDYDYYGGVESEWELLKFNGKPFEWLENRLTGQDRSDIEVEIQEYMESQNEPDYYEDDDE